MSCLRFSSKSSGGESKHRFSWGSLFSHSSVSEGKKPKSKSAPLSSSSQSDAEASQHAKQRAPSAAVSEGEGTSTSSKQKKPELLVFTYAELRAVAGNFSRSSLLGEGGFGCVYKGTLKGNTNSNGERSEKEVAVKLLNRNGQQGHKEWLAEVRFLGVVEHPNLVKLVGYCAEDDERGIQRLLVYEFMARGSLEDYLFRPEYPVLPWLQRLYIILGAAQGLAYLHEGMEGKPIIFRDFKTSNVLLDEDWTPKLSDFGLARQGPEMGATHVSTSVVGTLGYAAPEYVQTGRLTVKSDVWSFGVVLFEMLTGRRSLDRNRPKRDQHLLEWMRPYLHGNKKVPALMDPRLEGDYSLVQAQQLVDLALHCCHRAPKARPSMTVVVGKLRRILEGGEGDDRHKQPSTPSAEAQGSSKSKQRIAHPKEREFLAGDVKTREWVSEPIPISS